MAVQTVVNQPPQFVQDLGTDLAKQITAQSGVPVVSTGIAGISQQPGESAADFQARQDAARAFTTRQQSLAGLAPTVAGQDVLQQAATRLGAESAGIDPTTGKQTGIASFEPFLQKAQTAAAAATDPKIAQQFMSPFQSQVIDATLDEFDRNKKIQEQQIRDQQTALGALGSGRAGVQLAEFGTGAARERALLQAGLLQQGFGQAQQAAQQSFANQMGLASAIPSLQGTNIARLGQLGALNQAQAQAQADATREAARQATFSPQEQLDRFAGQVTGIMGGYPGQTQTTNIPNPTPLQTALGIGTTLAGVYGAFRNPNKNTDFGSIAAAGTKFI